LESDYRVWGGKDRRAVREVGGGEAGYNLLNEGRGSGGVLRAFNVGGGGGKIWDGGGLEHGRAQIQQKLKTGSGKTVEVERGRRGGRRLERCRPETDRSKTEKVIVDHGSGEIF